MPRRRPDQLRTRRPVHCGSGRPIPAIPRTSASTARAVAELERTRLHPGAVAEALTAWARFVRAPVRELEDHAPGACPNPDCQWDDPVVRRRALGAALHALPVAAARELRALVRPLDETFLARSLPTPRTAHIRDLLTEPGRGEPRPWPADAFTFTVELAALGWLRVRVGDGRAEQKVLASYLTPALDQLLAALVSLTTGARDARVDWELEPGRCRWLLTADPYGHARVRIRLVADRDLDLPDAGHPVLDADIPLRDLVRTVAAGARALLTRHGEDGYARLWHAGPFPTGHLLALERWCDRS
ncbi:hypothetical protein [Pseudonocardia humida]|uniref:Uncharacterized protein n=1 Tax=Pseudonocardia humida TaxID=2800819 RepID=A0ABT1A9W2_9PSEU|nr:hypothetical protein [Pseudonocardia humida]MCO1659820.1 hypothetical protein [Pseudonocardia humida]